MSCYIGRCDEELALLFFLNTDQSQDRGLSSMLTKVWSYSATTSSLSYEQWVLGKTAFCPSVGLSDSQGVGLTERSMTPLTHLHRRRGIVELVECSDAQSSYNSRPHGTCLTRISREEVHGIQPLRTARATCAEAQRAMTDRTIRGRILQPVLKSGPGY